MGTANQNLLIQILSEVKFSELLEEYDSVLGSRVFLEFLEANIVEIANRMDSQGTDHCASVIKSFYAYSADFTRKLVHLTREGDGNKYQLNYLFCTSFSQELDFFYKLIQYGLKPTQEQVDSIVNYFVVEKKNNLNFAIKILTVMWHNGIDLRVDGNGMMNSSKITEVFHLSKREVNTLKKMLSQAPPSFYKCKKCGEMLQFEKGMQEHLKSKHNK